VPRGQSVDLGLGHLRVVDQLRASTFHHHLEPAAVRPCGVARSRSTVGLFVDDNGGAAGEGRLAYLSLLS